MLGALVKATQIVGIDSMGKVLAERFKGALQASNADALRLGLRGGEARMSWKELEEGGVVKGGTSSAYVVNGWRVKRPVIDESKCTNCLICWIYCPSRPS